jgi:hypothetical protein
MFYMRSHALTCTPDKAVLLLLLLESDAPPLVDQPEDDLDNRFIAESIVPTMREEKRKRQFIFSSHNANIPVLGDAEQIVGLTPIVDDGVEQATIPEELCGSIDTPSVKQLIKELLEGGQEAFSFLTLRQSSALNKHVQSYRASQADLRRARALNEDTQGDT